MTAPWAGVLAALLAALPALASDEEAPPLHRFPERSSKPLPDFYPERAKATRSGAGAKETADGPLWFGAAAVGLETVTWKIEAGSGAFPRYRTSAPSYPNDTHRLDLVTYGYADVPDGTLPVFVSLQGGVQLAPGWRLGLRYGYSRTGGPEIDVSRHAFDAGTDLHPFQRYVFVRAAIGRDLLVFSDPAGSSTYSRYTMTLGVGGTIPLRPRLTVPVALETTRTFTTDRDDGLPAWSAVRLTAGVAFQ